MSEESVSIGWKSISMILAVFLVISVGGNVYMMFGAAPSSASTSLGGSTGAIIADSGTTDTDTLMQQLYSELPKGTPAVYGNELKISYNDVQGSLNILKEYDLTYGSGLVELNSEETQRYADIGGSISCEYCCGAKFITAPDGTAACGCAHSQAMRGLTAYLIKNHPNMSNTEILDELLGWKSLYFPKQTIAKQIQAMGVNPTSAGLPDMVGGC